MKLYIILNLKNKLTELITQTYLMFFEILISLYLIFKIKNNKSNGNKGCLILGNGPSLKESIKNIDQSMDSLDVFVVNAFNKSNDFKTIKPNNYCILDSGYLNLSLTRVDLNNNILQTINDLNNIDWNMKLYLPLSHTGSYFEKNINSSFIQIIHFSNYPFKSLLRFYFVKSGLGIIGGKNVINACLSIAITKKYKDIYLAGIDHSWLDEVLVDEIGTHKIERHSYDDETKKVYHKKIELGLGLISLGKLLIDYHDIKKYSVFMKTNIFHLDKKSYVNAFK